MFTLQCSKLTNNPKEYSERTLQEFISYIRPVVDPEHTCFLEVRSTKQNYVFYPFWIITHLSFNGWPKILEYEFKPQMPGKSRQRLIEEVRNPLGLKEGETQASVDVRYRTEREVEEGDGSGTPRQRSVERVRRGR